MPGLVLFNGGTGNNTFYQNLVIYNNKHLLYYGTVSEGQKYGSS